MRMTTDWSSLMNATGSLREQSRRESNGTRHRETMAINIECAQDNPRVYGRTPSVNRQAINESVKQQNKRIMHSDIMMRFGPRLVRKDGSALYQFQCKK